MSKEKLEQLLNQIDQLSISEREILLDRLMTPYSEFEIEEAIIVEIMDGLSHMRPIFHSEGDFQLMLAQQIRNFLPDCEVILEHHPFPQEQMRIDLWLPEVKVAMELKYATQMLNHSEGGNYFSLKNHAANDIRRYDFLKDIERLERVSRQNHVRGGFAIFLTNDPLYWQKPKRPNNNDAAFHLYEGRQLFGNLAWSESAGEGTTTTREAPIQLDQHYELHWRKYGSLGIKKYQEFRYLLVHVHD